MQRQLYLCEIILTGNDIIESISLYSQPNLLHLALLQGVELQREGHGDLLHEVHRVDVALQVALRPRRPLPQALPALPAVERRGAGAGPTSVGTLAAGGEFGRIA